MVKRAALVGEHTLAAATTFATLTISSKAQKEKRNLRKSQVPVTVYGMVTLKSIFKLN